MRWKRALILIVLAIGVFLALMPMRFALGMLSGPKSPITAAAAGGWIWSGAIADLQVGKVAIGNVDARLRFLPLLLGKAQFTIARGSKPGIAPLNGDFSFNGNQLSVDNLNGKLDVSRAFGNLPITNAQFENFTAAFDDRRCSRAAGKLRVELGATGLPGLNLKNGLLGDVRCKGDALEIPLLSQSAMERIDLTVKADGTYQYAVLVQTVDNEVAASLSALGFVPVAGGVRLNGKGQF